MAETIKEVGIATGMAWTPVGGEVMFIEATRMPGKGNLLLTGSLGEVMKESAQTALSYLRSQSASLGIDMTDYGKLDIHIHVPAGATPKDGPSAGVTLLVALASLLTKGRVRSEVAMTGEISLRGRVLRVGGIKEKVLAAARFGIKQIVLPDQNRTDWAGGARRSPQKTPGAFRAAHLRASPADAEREMRARGVQGNAAMIRRALPIAAAALLLTAAALPDSLPKTFSPAEGSERGRALVAEILSQTPAESSLKGTLEIRSGKHIERFSVETAVSPLDGGWQSLYFASNSAAAEKLVVIHSARAPNRYLYGRTSTPGTAAPAVVAISEAEAETNAFAGSDFSPADLGLEFFHWPEQRVLKTEMRRSRSCRVLESVNPRPVPGACARIVSWIDLESDAIVHAEACDASGQVLKEFDPKKMKKVGGQWQLEEMEINNRRTGSRTRIDFNLGSDPG